MRQNMNLDKHKFSSTQFMPGLRNEEITNCAVNLSSYQETPKLQENLG